MSDVSAVAPTEPLGNSPGTREPTGEIKNLAETSSETPKETQSSAAAEKETSPKPEAGAPEKYEDFKLPEGFKINEKAMGEATALFKELNLPQEAAQKLLGVYVKQLQEASNAPFTAFEELRSNWRKEIISDPVYGDGTGLKPEVSAVIGRAIDSMGVEEAKAFREAMEITGAGDNPAIFKGILALAKAATEGRPVLGRGPSPAGQSPPAARPSAAKALFPNLA